MLVVVAHPDDETFGCGSIIARAAASGDRVVIACFTAGELGEPAPGYTVGSDGLGAGRAAELRAAAAILGASGVRLLGFVDSGWVGDVAPDSLCGAPDSDVVEVRERAIAAHRSQASPFLAISPALRRAMLTTDHLARLR